MKAPPSAADIAEISEVWKPYRTWVALLFRIMLEDETHDNCRTSHHQNARTVTPCGPDMEVWAQLEHPSPVPKWPSSIEVHPASSSSVSPPMDRRPLLSKQSLFLSLTSSA